MSTGIKNGKKPLSTKPSFNTNLQDAGFGDKLYVEPALKAEIEAKGLECRWVDYKKLMDYGGVHENNWRAYQADTATEEQYGFLLGKDPNGLIRRGHCVLAVKPKDMAERHRAKLKEKADRYSSMVHKQKKEELQEDARRAGGGIKITAGDEEQSE